MDDFEFQNPTRIIFGHGAENKVGHFAKQYGKRVLLHYGSGSIKASGLYARVIDSLKKAELEVFELPGVKPNPRLSLVREGIQICRDKNINLILAVGGGSVIDSSKAIAAGVLYDGDVWDFYTGKATPTQALPIGTVLTIPAAGSESSTGTVITNDEGQLKRAFDNEVVYPRFSALNPELAFTLPKFQAACGIMDMMAHLMERYFTNSPSVELIDRLIEANLKTIINNGPAVLEKNDNYDAWAQVMWSGCVAHNNLFSTGRVGDWASHDIEHELSGIYDVAHGAGLAVIFPAWMRYVWKHDTARFVQYAVRVWDVELNAFDLEKTAQEGINRLTQFIESLGLSSRLRGLGIGDEHLEEMARKCTGNNRASVGNFVKLKEKDVFSILKSSL